MKSKVKDMKVYCHCRTPRSKGADPLKHPTPPWMKLTSKGSGVRKWWEFECPCGNQVTISIDNK